MDEKNVKCYVMDTGLLIYKAMMENDQERNRLYKTIILNKLSINEGMCFENMVAQELWASGHGLYHHRFKVEESTKTYEVDFPLTSGKKVIPIKVKSGRSRPHSSLDHFIDKYPNGCDEIFVVHSKDLMVEDGITYIPIYMTMFL